MIVASSHGATAALAQHRTPPEATMAKGQQSKKDTKKQPQMTLKEKRAAKAAKKAMKG
ncbi:MAG: hypothetical protein WBO45_12480 [Planctomycetota bacterium]